jgi:hypothetical protein
VCVCVHACRERLQLWPISMCFIGETEENQKNASFKSQCLSQDLKWLPPKSKIECSWQSRRKGICNLTGKD